MKVFISWSGELSKEIAKVLKQWLKNVIQCVEPYVSFEDIPPGKLWIAELSKKLQNTNFGIICLTRENFQKPWLLFEAGAILKELDASYVVPLLFDLSLSDINDSPLQQFNAISFLKNDIKKLIDTLNTACEPNSLDERSLDKAFRVWYPHLEKSLNKIRSSRFNMSLQIPSNVKRCFRSTEAMDDYFADCVREAKYEVCSLMWQDDTEGYVPFDKDREIRQGKMSSAIKLFCEDKGHIYRELFTFSFAKRYNIMTERILYGGNYQCRYYDNLGIDLPNRFPKLQFRIIDNEEVIFASRKYQDGLCAIFDSSLAKTMKCYFDMAWGNALKISSPNPKEQQDTLDYIHNKLNDYRLLS